MQITNVVITGADGFLGSHLIKHLISKGLEVYAIVLPSSPTLYRIKDLKNVNIIETHLDSLESKRFLPECPLAFIHLAWDGVAPKDRNNQIRQTHNIEIAKIATELAYMIHAQKFILPGSTSEYPYYGKPIDKYATPSPVNLYGVVKCKVKENSRNYCKSVGLPFINVVITGIYSEDRMDDNVIYYTITTLLKGKEPELTSLEQQWDYVHIDDVVEALYLICIKGKDGSFYTVGHGDNWPLKNYIMIIRNIINPKSKLGIGKKKFEGNLLPSSCVDLSAIEQDTGYHPQISFEDGIKRVIQNVKKQM